MFVYFLYVEKSKIVALYVIPVLLKIYHFYRIRAKNEIQKVENLDVMGQHGCYFQNQDMSIG